MLQRNNSEAKFRRLSLLLGNQMSDRTKTGTVEISSTRSMIYPAKFDISVAMATWLLLATSNQGHL